VVGDFEKYIMKSKKVNQKAQSYLLETIIAVFVIYFLFGGSNGSPALWAIFIVLGICILIVNVRYDAGSYSANAYARWKLVIAFIMIIGLLVTSIWRSSLWLFVLSMVLGLIWVKDLRAYQVIKRLKKT
jgi:hypothetical protein